MSRTAPTTSSLNLKKSNDRRFYVYALADPRDGAVFYVGKGTGGRASCHEMNAKAGTHCNQRVSERIGSLSKAGHRPVVSRLADRLTEAEALNRERQEIASRDGLCNIAPGHRSWLEIRRARIKAAIQRFPRIGTLKTPEAKSLLLEFLKGAALEFKSPTPDELMESGPWPPPSLSGRRLGFRS